MDEVEALCQLLTRMKVDGILISPGYHYESVENDVFMTQEQIHEKFKRVKDMLYRYRLTATPTFWISRPVLSSCVARPGRP